jgi:hypothetical protein
MYAKSEDNQQNSADCLRFFRGLLGNVKRSTLDKLRLCSGEASVHRSIAAYCPTNRYTPSQNLRKAERVRSALKEI